MDAKMFSWMFFFFCAIDDQCIEECASNLRRTNRFAGGTLEHITLVDRRRQWNAESTAIKPVEVVVKSVFWEIIHYYWYNDPSDGSEWLNCNMRTVFRWLIFLFSPLVVAVFAVAKWARHTPRSNGFFDFIGLHTEQLNTMIYLCLSHLP